MKQKISWLILLGFMQIIFAQQPIDSLYLEDQIYLSTAYSFPLRSPSQFSQAGFSGEFSGGFIKDIPVSKQRNIAFGIGVGYAYNVYNSNLKLSTVGGKTQFSIADIYTKNRLHTHLIEFPLEFRWRNSTPTRYSFMRVYGGVKLSYLLHSKSNFVDNTSSIAIKNISEIQKFQYGIHLAIGYGTWNLYTYYELQPLFKNAVLSNKKLTLSRLTVGLKFYLL